MFICLLIFFQILGNYFIINIKNFNNEIKLLIIYRNLLIPNLKNQLIFQIQ